MNSFAELMRQGDKAGHADVATRRASRSREAAIRSEEYAAAHPGEIARRRLFFRRLLGVSRWSGRAEAATDGGEYG